MTMQAIHEGETGLDGTVMSVDNGSIQQRTPLFERYLASRKRTAAYCETWKRTQT